MSDSDTLDHLVEIMLDGDDDSLSDLILTESEKDEILFALEGETTLMNYIMLFEEYLEEHDIYLFKGWENAQLIGKPIVEKFWITFNLLVDENTDIRGAKRVQQAMSQGEVKAKKLQDGRRVVQFMVLRRDLDQIEKANKERIDQLSDQAIGEL